MSPSQITDDLKDAIIDVISDEYYHRTGGETRHWLEEIELVLGGIVTAFVIPYLKKLAEKSAEGTWAAITPSPEKGDDATTGDSKAPANAESLIRRATSDDHRAASEVAAESVRIAMLQHRFSDSAQAIIIQKLYRSA